MKKRIYLAAPLFNEQERKFNLFIKENLISHYDLYLPQEDGMLLAELMELENISISVAQKKVFDLDIKEMNNSDLLIAILDGSNIDEGVAFEIGYMNALNKPCFGLQTDVRRQLPFGNNPMIEKGLKKIFNNTDDLFNFLKSNI